MKKTNNPLANEDLILATEGRVNRRKTCILAPTFAAIRCAGQLGSSHQRTQHVIIHQKLCLCGSFLLPMRFPKNDSVDSEDSTRELDVS